MRTREGMAIARAKGKLKGKQPKLTRTQRSHLYELLLTGDKPTELPRSSVGALI